MVLFRQGEAYRLQMVLLACAMGAERTRRVTLAIGSRNIVMW
jgi:hypothetical protein